MIDPATKTDAVMDLLIVDGRISERGAHRELLELNGLYAQMYRRQLLEEELEVDEEREEHAKRVKATDDDQPPFRVRPRFGGLETEGS